MKVEYNNITLNIPERYAIDNLTNRFKKQIYESSEVSLIKYLESEDNVLELGSCLGYISVLSSQRVKNIISIEANPELINSLEETKRDNKCNNLQFINTIIDKSTPEKEMWTYDLIVAGSADRDDKENPGYNNRWNQNIKKYNVKTTSIEDLEKNYNICFDTLIVDIEGGELDLFKQNKNYIKNNIKKIIVELHGGLMKDKQFNNKCLNILKDCGFNIISSNRGSYYLNKI